MTLETIERTAKARIRALIDDWAKAMRAKDVDGVLAHVAADIVTFDLAPPLLSTGPDAQGLQAWFATWQGPLGYEIRGLRITGGDDAAFCHGLSRLRGTKTDGVQADVRFRLTLGLRKIGVPGRSRISTNPCRSTWMAASGWRSISGHSNLADDAAPGRHGGVLEQRRQADGGIGRRADPR